MSMSLQEPKCGPYIDSTLQLKSVIHSKPREGNVSLPFARLKSPAGQFAHLTWTTSNGSHSTWQSGHFVAIAHTIQLGDIPGHVDILIFHVDDCIEEHIKIFYTSDVLIEHNDQQEQNAAPVPNR